MAGWRRAFRLHLRGGTVKQDLDDEIAFHVEMRTQDLIDEGMAPHAAREEALRLFGNMAGIRRQCEEIGRRRERGRHWSEVASELRQDALFALRQLRKAPAFSIVAVFTLALGIGATTAIFSLLHAVVLRPFPFPQPERIVYLWSIDRGDDHRSVAPGNFVTFRRDAKSFERLATYTGASFNLSGDGPPERVVGARVSAGYFDVFGVKPALGRVFAEAEDRPGSEQVVVLSERLWRERFGADPAVIGRSIRMNGKPYEVTGVMPASFRLRSTEPWLWTPIALSAEDETNYGYSYLHVLGRLKPGVTPEAAQAEVAGIARRLETIAPDNNQNKGAHLESYKESLLGATTRRYLILLGAVGCVLLIACVNVANLLLARSAARAREIAIRAALGAGRGRIVRQLLTESLVLALTGAAAGVAMAYGGVRFLVAISPARVPRIAEAGIDGPVLVFALAVGMASSLVFGLVPALRTARPDLQGMLKEGGRSLGAHRDWVKTGLMVTEVALALMLLVSAGLLIRSALRLQQVELGFDPAGVLTAQLSLPRGDYPEPAQVVQTLQRVVDEAGAVAGVGSAAATSIVPLSRYNTSSSLEIEGKPLEGEEQIEGNTRQISSGYFKTLGISLRGRDFTAGDRPGALRVAIVNETLARRAWPGENAVGKRLSYWTDEEENPVWHVVVGVAGDIRQQDLTEDARPEIYVPMAQASEDLWGDRDISMALVVRAAADPAALAAPVRQAVLRVDPRLPVFDVATMDQLRATWTATTRFNMLLLTALGVIGLVLAAVGIYGVIAYFVGQRTQEIGLRMALGATENRVLAMVTWQALRPVLAGLAVGVAGAAAASRVLSSLLYGVTATDPATFAGVLVVLAVAALLASWVPARRAARVDPSRALAP
ncbi:MAG TPA: ABC transporter permease [Thermoanaerobaculia bacterium]